MIMKRIITDDENGYIRVRRRNKSTIAQTMLGKTSGNQIKNNNNNNRNKPQQSLSKVKALRNLKYQAECCLIEEECHSGLMLSYIKPYILSMFKLWLKKSSFLSHLQINS